MRQIRITIMVILAFFTSYNCIASDRVIKRIQNKIYLVENEDSSEIDETKVLVKMKSKERCQSFLCRNGKNLGFDIIELHVPDDLKVEDYVSKLRQSDDFEFVEYNTIGRYSFLPNDTLIGAQWYLNRIKAYDAWNITTGASSVKVAVLDSGVDADHYDLNFGNDNYRNVNFAEGYYYPTNTTYSQPVIPHGTMVAGIIGAKTNNTTGIAGISGGNGASGIEIISFCVGENNPSSDYVISAINSAITKGVKVINMSLTLGTYNSAVACAIDAAYNQDITIICAAGNNGNSSVQFPASYDKTIAVGATDSFDCRPYWSNYGTGLDLVAPGIGIKSATLNNTYTAADGTSFAAPQVTGVTALMLSVNPNLSPDNIKFILNSTAQKINSSTYAYNNFGWNNEVGYGLLNADSAVIIAKDFEISGPIVVCDSAVYSVAFLPIGCTVTWTRVNQSYGCLFYTDYPASNQCTIKQVGNTPYEGTLVAKIYENGNLVSELEKTIYIKKDFEAKYSQEACTYYGVNHPAITQRNVVLNNAHFVHQGCTVEVKSENFKGLNVSHRGITPSTFNYDGNLTVTFSLPYGSSGAPFYITAHQEDSCSDFEILFFAISGNGNISSSFLNIESTNNGFLLNLVSQKSDETYIEQKEDNNSIVWDLEVYNIKTGRNMLKTKVNGFSYLLQSKNWGTGNYIIRAIYDNQVFTNKIRVE